MPGLVAGVSGTLAIKQHRSRGESRRASQATSLPRVRIGVRRYSSGSVSSAPVLDQESRSPLDRGNVWGRWPRLSDPTVFGYSSSSAEAASRYWQAKTFGKLPKLQEKPGVQSEDLKEELPNGKNAWRTDGKRGKTRNWNGKNRNEGPQQQSQANKNSPPNKQGGVVNILLYVGFLLFAVGLILTLVGMGDRGFKTEELKLIGPTLIICGLVFALLRILFCSCDTCTKPKPQDEKKLLSPSTDTIDGTGTANPAFQADPEPPRLPPLRQVQRAPKVSAAEASEPTPPMQSLDDEVEEDMALGLEVDYAEEPTPKEPSVSRPPSESTVRVVSEMPASAKESRSQLSDGDGAEESEEVILNPAKLRKT